jgi:hypothetical protein
MKPEERNKRLLLEIESIPPEGSHESLVRVLSELKNWAVPFELENKVGDLILFVESHDDAFYDLQEILTALDAVDVDDAKGVIMELQNQK